MSLPVTPREDEFLSRTLSPESMSSSAMVVPPNNKLERTGSKPAAQPPTVMRQGRVSERK